MFMYEKVMTNILKKKLPLIAMIKSIEKVNSDGRIKTEMFVTVLFQS